MNLKLRHIVKDAAKEMMELIENNPIGEFKSLEDILANDSEFKTKYNDLQLRYKLLLPIEQITRVLDLFNLDKEYFVKYPVLKKTDTDEEFIVLTPFEEDIKLGYFDVDETGNFLSFVPEKYLNPMSLDTKYDFLEKWEHSETLKRVVITHAKCNDGAAVAAVVKHHRDIILKDNNIEDNIEFIYLDYSNYNIEDIKSKVKGKLVYVGDYSFPYGDYLDLLLTAEEIVTVDHHQGALDDIGLAEHFTVHLDLTKSGGELTVDFFLGKERDIDYNVIKLIGDRDLWNWFYGSFTEAMAMMIKKEGYEVISKYLTTNMSISNLNLMEDLEEYKEEAVKQDRKYLDKANEAEEFTIAGIKMYGLNLTVGPSEILNHVSRLNNTPSFCYSFKDNIMTFSFRNYKDEVDVNELAKMYGGKGHAQSSGAKVNTSNILLEDFFLDRTLNVKYIVEDEETLKLFEHYGVDKLWVKNSKHCEVIQQALGKTFGELFVVTRDAKMNLVLKLKD